jgi:hypothetical protein
MLGILWNSEGGIRETGDRWKRFITVMFIKNDNSE